jgi:hypothetical protein
MNAAEQATISVIESTLSEHGSYRRLDDHLFVIKQGSTFVTISVVAWADDKALVRCCAQVVRGVQMCGELAEDLLHLNGQLRFGAFAYDPHDSIVLFLHSILGGTTLDADELLATLTDVAIIADQYDDQIIELYGGQTMHDVLEEQSLERVLQSEPASFSFRKSQESDHAQ